MTYKSDWQVGSTKDEAPVIIRARSTLPKQNYQSEFQHLIIIKWVYEAAERGMPDKETQESMDVFENKLDKALENTGTGILAATVTGKSVKEWRYYNSDTQKFMESLNAISAPEKPFPIDLQLFNDPSWEALKELS